MFRLLCFAIIRLLHYLLGAYMCKAIRCDTLVITRERVGMPTLSREITNISQPIVLHM
jgi:hypothetical protein